MSNNTPKSNFNFIAVIGLITGAIGLSTALVSNSTERLKLEQQKQQASSSNGSATSSELQQPLSGNSPGNQSGESSEDSLDTPSNSRDSDSLDGTSPDNPSSYSTAVAYSRLEDFLQTGQYEAADQETVRLMLKVANREDEGSLDNDSIRNFPCDVLKKIEGVWQETEKGTANSFKSYNGWYCEFEWCSELGDDHETDEPDDRDLFLSRAEICRL